MISWKDFLKKINISFDESVESEIRSLMIVYDCKTENESFFYWLKNKVGSYLCDEDDLVDCFAWLKIVARNTIDDWYMFEFEENDDFILLLELESMIKEKLDSDGIKLFDALKNQCINSLFIKNK